MRFLVVKSRDASRLNFERLWVDSSGSATIYQLAPAPNQVLKTAQAPAASNVLAPAPEPPGFWAAPRQVLKTAPGLGKCARAPAGPTPAPHS